MKNGKLTFFFLVLYMSVFFLVSFELQLSAGTRMYVLDSFCRTIIGKSYERSLETAKTSSSHYQILHGIASAKMRLAPEIVVS